LAPPPPPPRRAPGVISAISPPLIIIWCNGTPNALASFVTTNALFCGTTESTVPGAPARPHRPARWT
jgi:hypothetical protein